MNTKQRTATAAQAGANLAIVQSTVGVVLRCVLAVFFLEVVLGAGLYAAGMPPSLWFAIVKGILMSILLLPVFFSLVLRPVAELAAKHAAAAAESQFQTIAQAVQDGIVIFDARCNIQFANEAAELMHGYPSGSLRGMPMEMIIPAEMKEMFRAGIEQFLTSGQSPVIGKGATEQDGLRRNGERFPIEISVSALVSDAEKRFVLVLRDISTRKNVDREIQERTSRLNALLANSPLAIVVLDKNRRVQMCNPAFEDMFQYRSAEIAGLELDGLVASEELMAEASRMTENNLQGKVSHVITRRRRKDGSQVDVEIHGVPLLIGHQVEGSYGIYQDITERKKLKLYEQLLPVCCVCGKIRDDQGMAPGQGAWDRLDRYISKHTDARLTHTFCPECLVQYRKEQGLK